jgi:hypothetical protein
MRGFNLKIALVMFAFSVLASGQFLYSQQSQPSTIRHPDDILRYQITLEGGDADKVDTITIGFDSTEGVPANQPGLTNGFRGQCKKSSTAPDVWDCSATIPHNIADGDYRLGRVDVAAGMFAKGYTEDFHVRLVPIKNPQTFTPPSKVTVKEQP